MCRFQNKLIWQFFKFNLIKLIPNTKRRDNVLFAYAFFYVFFCQILVYHFCILWLSII